MITGSTVASISVIKTALHDAFEMSDLGLLKQFLGLEIAENYDGIMVTQSKYILDLLVKFNMAKCKAAPFPFLSGISLEETLEEISTQNGPFNFYSNSMSSCVSQ